MPVDGDRLRGDGGTKSRGVLDQRAEVEAQLVGSALRRDPSEEVRGVVVQGGEPRARFRERAARVIVRVHADAVRVDVVREDVRRRERPRQVRSAHHLRGVRRRGAQVRKEEGGAGRRSGTRLPAILVQVRGDVRHVVRRSARAKPRPAAGAPRDAAAPGNAFALGGRFRRFGRNVSS